MLARLLVAPAAQAPRLITLHHPSRTPAGRKTIGDLRDRWLNSLRGPDRRIQGYLLRQPETTYAAAPELPAGMVRWILPYEPEARSWRDRSQSEGLADEGPAEQWLPRHLRPLVHLDTVWKQGDSLTGYLLKALLAAREIEDEVLFKEILEATLSRANHELFAADEKDLVPSATRFQALLADLEEVKGTWEGKSESLDLRMRITMIRSLLDGDTLWRLSHAGGEPAAKEALGAIIRLVHRSLGKGDLLLALETLRAVNVALLRLCQRLERRGEDQDWSLEDGSHLVPWTALYGFYQAIGDFAARMAHPKGTLGEVVSHEISRAYALGMIACPPAIAELAMWLAEADLPTDTSERVVNQVYLLGALLKPELRLSTSLHDLLLLAFGLGQAGSYYERALLILPTGEMKITNPAVFGRDNVRTAEARKPFDDIIVWLQALARQLIDDAGGVDLKAYQTLYKGIKDAPPGEEDQLHHSRHFWKKALEELAAACGRFPDLFPASGEEPGGDGLPLRPVRPELVLFSRTLGAWCQGQRKRLQELRAEYEIFEPASLLYDESLSLVERAAERFRHGAAVQKNLVLGVLGHGLLELMDEHLLEVWEIALALAPRLASEKRLLEEGAGSFSKEEEEARKKEPTSTAERFADYLLQRALKAEVIPKNLRSLQGLLSFTDQPAESRLTLKELFKEYETWEIIGQGEILETELNQRTYHFLNLTLNELQQNHRMHGLRGSRPTVRPGRNALRFEFCYPADSKQIERAHLLSRLRLQMMMPPREEPRVPSHGTGLYLANLAAGAVGWKLKTHRSLRDGVLRFSLIRRDKVTS